MHLYGIVTIHCHTSLLIRVDCIMYGMRTQFKAACRPSPTVVRGVAVGVGARRFAIAFMRIYTYTQFRKFLEFKGTIMNE